MPCNGGPDGYAYGGPTKEQQLCPPILCGIFTVLEREGSLAEVLALVDWAEVGTSKAVTLAWWEDHKKRDEERRAHEDRMRKKKEARRKALAKLTRSERRVLGLID